VSATWTTDKFIEKDLLEDDYLYMEGVEGLTFYFGADREFDTFLGIPPDLPPLGAVKGRRGNPTVQQVQEYGADGIAVNPTDMIWTIFANTLGPYAPGGELIFAWYKPKPGDQIAVQRSRTDIEEWIIRDVKTAVYDSQYICLCSELETSYQGVR